MNMRWCRGLAVAVSLASSAMFAGAAIVFACSPAPPQLTLTPDQASPGQVVTASGSGYGGAGSPVVVRLDGQDGPVLWTGQADGAGAIAFSFVTPSMPPGFDFINAYPTGAAAAKGPAHASFQVAAAGTPPIEAAPRAVAGGGRPSIIAPASTPHTFPASPASIAPALLIALVAVSLVGAALLVVAVTHRRRRSNIAASSAEHDGAAQRRSPPLSEFVIIARSRTATALPSGGETEVGAAADSAT